MYNEAGCGEPALPSLTQRVVLDLVRRSGRDERGLLWALLKLHKAEEGARMVKGEGDFPEAAVAVDGGRESRRPETGRQLGADLKFVGEIQPRGETDDGLAVGQADGKRGRGQGAKGNGEVGAILEQGVPVHRPKGHLIVAGAIHGEGSAMDMTIAPQRHGKSRSISGGLGPSTRAAPGGGGGPDIPEGKRATRRPGDGHQLDFGITAFRRIESRRQ